MDKISIIWNYLNGTLEREKEQEVRNLIKSNAEFARNVLKVRSVWDFINDSSSRIKADLISDFINGKLSDEEEKNVEDFLKEMGDLDFYREMRSPSIKVGEDGEIFYIGNDKELKSIISQINEEKLHRRMFKLVKEYARKEFALMGLADAIKVLSPENQHICTSPEIEFTFDCEKDAEVKGYVINIYENGEDVIKKIKLEKRHTIVNLSDFKPGHYFWKFISPTNNLLEVRVFHLLYKK